MALNYDIVVIGGGHAGTEAAWAAAKMGCSAALVTMRIDAIGRMSCNPAIGGLGKGQMVREIDALGGLMGLAIDQAGIQFRTLNASKGPAVQAPRAQADRRLYAEAVQGMLRSVDGLDLVEATVDELLVEEEGGTGRGGEGETGSAPSAREFRITGVRLGDGREIRCRAVIVTAGTFLRGLMHTGEQKTEGGRVGEQAAVGLSASFQKLGLRMGRLKTGTPPRVHRDSVDYRILAPQPGDDPPVPFSFMTERITQRQVECWITHTNERTHEAIRDNIHRAPMYSGQIQSRGPRYCPSIEDKIMRFADKPSHQVFLEPEGYDNPLIYCNGIPTSLPKDVQDVMIHSIAGLERAEIVQYGYAVEYDWLPTDQITLTLETKRIGGLFIAGQLNGTSGYEEAAGQGLLAGLNAAAGLKGEPPTVLKRDEAYLGVMIDDIVTRPPDEPYRMFTSRAEYRLHLRSDNADQRLTPLGRRLGLVDDRRWDSFERKRKCIEALTATLQSTRREGRSLWERLKRPEITLTGLEAEGPIDDLSDYDPLVIRAVEIEARYEGYLQRERQQIERFRHLEGQRIPEGFDFGAIRELRHEARERFGRLSPTSLGQAARMTGISPADIATLSIYLAQTRVSA